MTALQAPDRLMPGPAIPEMEGPGPLCAAHTPNFPALLRQLGTSRNSQT